MADDLLRAVQTANAASTADARRATDAAAARVEFERWEQSQAEELAKTLLQAVELLRNHGPHPTNITVGRSKWLGVPRTTQGWEQPGEQWFKLGADGTVFAGGTSSGDGKSFSLRSFPPLEWARSRVVASRQRAYQVQDSYFEDSAYVKAFERGDLGSVGAVRSEVLRNRAGAIERLGQLLSDLGVRVPPRTLTPERHHEHSAS